MKDNIWLEFEKKLEELFDCDGSFTEKELESTLALAIDCIKNEIELPVEVVIDKEGIKMKCPVCTTEIKDFRYVDRVFYCTWCAQKVFVK